MKKLKLWTDDSWLYLIAGILTGLVIISLLNIGTP